MPDIGLRMRPAADFDLSIYVPVHFDLSQIEYVAPFLEEFKGSKVFIYKWNGIYQKIKNYYLHSPEYQAAELGVYDFSIKNIVHAILSEPRGRKVVFLMTASIAYLFGEYQRDLLKAVKMELDALADQMQQDGLRLGDAAMVERAKELRDKVWGVSVIGHCMYGCNSCKGNDHKIPVYYTRYFHGSIPYTKEHIRQQFRIQGGSDAEALAQRPIPVLCAPSTGETTLLLHRDILEYLKGLQDAGLFRFVWKFHPMVYNEKSYDERSDVDRTEKANVKWLMANFECTREDEPCLLPFIEAFPIIFCDLHSSVPFIASYFSPKAIVCYHNDADYEVPAGRDPEFLAQLHVYEHLDGLQNILHAKGGVPEARGDISFFWKTYGKVDGNEVGRFASLCEWPLKQGETRTSASSASAGSLLEPAFRPAVARIARAWDAQLAQVEKGKDGDRPDEDAIGDMKQAIGLFPEVEMLPRPHVQQYGVPGSSGAGAGMVAAAEEADSHPNEGGAAAATVSVASFNLWWGGEGAYRARILAGDARNGLQREPSNHEVDVPAAASQEQLIEYTARAILATDADVIGCQETGTLFRSADEAANERATDRGEFGSRKSALPAIAAKLRELSGNDKWTHIDQGILTPGKGVRHPWGILSRLEVVRESPNRFGVQVCVAEGTTAWVFNTHLPYKPYQPYAVEKPEAIPYEGAAPLKDAHEAVASASASRTHEVAALLADIASATGDISSVPVFLTADLNEPSHQDWTNLAAIAGYHPLPVPWPATSHIVKDGLFVDSLRAVYPDAVTHPFNTWATITEDVQSGRGDAEGWRKHGDGGRDVPDRIDFVFHRGRGVRCVDAMVAGNQLSIGANTDLVARGDVHLATDSLHWPSDHRAIVCKFQIALSQQ